MNLTQVSLQFAMIPQSPAMIFFSFHNVLFLQFAVLLMWLGLAILNQ